MNTIINKVVRRRYHFITNEKYVVDILKTISGLKNFSHDYAIGDCGWADEMEKWFIFTTLSNEQWNAVRDELSKKGYVFTIGPHKDIYVLKEKYKRVDGYGMDGYYI